MAPPQASSPTIATKVSVHAHSMLISQTHVTADILLWLCSARLVHLDHHGCHPFCRGSLATLLAIPWVSLSSLSCRWCLPWEYLHATSLPWFFYHGSSSSASRILTSPGHQSFASRDHGHSAMIVHFHHGSCPHCSRHHGLVCPWCSCVVILFHLSATMHGASAVFLHRGSSTRRAQPCYGPSAMVVRLAKLQHLLLYRMCVSVIIGLILPLQLLDVSSNCNVLMSLRHGRQSHDRGLLGPYQVFRCCQPPSPAYPLKKPWCSLSNFVFTALHY